MNVVVVGGGISGLVAAYRLSQRGADVTVLEADDRLGGKIQTTPFAGLPAVDTGADAFLARVPHAVDLSRELGFGDELISPARGNAYIWSRGALRPIPMPNFLGVPLDADSLQDSGLVLADAVAAVQADLTRTVDDGMPDGDESVGSLVRRRLGDEILERLVDPLLGGIYAGDADRLSLAAGAPQIAAAARADASIVRALRAQQATAAAAAPGTPIFFAPPDGMARVVRELAARLDSRVQRGHCVQHIERAPAGWRVDGIQADAVVIAAPAQVAGTLLTNVAPRASALASTIDYAGVVLVTLAFPREAVVQPLDASGFLVPKTEGMLLTACSWSSAKWSHLDRGEHVILRASAGHYGNEHALSIDDDVLVTALLDELTETMEIRAEPVEIRISRWPRAFPQYTPGHLERIEQLEASLASDARGLFVVGAAYRGIGIPACVAGATAAAERALGG